MRCARCLAVVPEVARSCPQCGFPISEGEGTVDGAKTVGWSDDDDPRPIATRRQRRSPKRSGRGRSFLTRERGAVRVDIAVTHGGEGHGPGCYESAPAQCVWRVSSVWTRQAGQTVRELFGGLSGRSSARATSRLARNCSFRPALGRRGAESIIHASVV
jgi:hypothetical protein